MKETKLKIHSMEMSLSAELNKENLYLRCCVTRIKSHFLSRLRMGMGLSASEHHEPPTGR